MAERLRPIAMSAVATVFGLAPLVFIPGEGTEFYRGVGAIGHFGILGAAIGSLTFLPAITTQLLRLRQKPSRKAASRRSSRDATDGYAALLPSHAGASAGGAAFKR